MFSRAPREPEAPSHLRPVILGHQVSLPSPLSLAPTTSPESPKQPIPERGRRVQLYSGTPKPLWHLSPGSEFSKQILKFQWVGGCPLVVSI